MLVTLWLVLSVLASIFVNTREFVVESWAITGILLALVAFADYLVGRMTCRNAANFQAERRAPHTVAVGMPCHIKIKFTNATSRRRTIEIYDRHPSSCIADDLPIHATIPAGRFADFQYEMTPGVRGDVHFGKIAARLTSPLGLWAVPFDLGRGERMRVFPNYAAVTRYALLAIDHRLSTIGVLKRQRRGEGMDFHQLREYREGDSPRSIDWKATARQVKLITREYQDERDQQVVFMLDCSRRMNGKDDGLSHFDQTLNAILLLTFVAIRQGDSAGLMTFGANEDRYVVPRKSPETVSRFLNALYPLEPSMKTPDYHQAALDLGKRMNKRSLIIVLSNLRDEDEEGLAGAMAQMKRRHLVMFANLKEMALEASLHPDANDIRKGRPARYSRADLIEYSAASQYSLAREKLLSRLRSQGVNILDVAPQKLPIALVNQYLDMKQSGAF
jgi:uncharacterized protein (DUF58 family)